MKVLHRLSDWEIAIYDDNNYCTYEWRKPNPKLSYHNRIDGAVREVSRLNANQVSNDLHEWLIAYSAASQMGLEGRREG